MGVALLFSTELHAATRFAALPPALRIPPEGLRWFVSVVPISEAFARAVTAVALFGAVATIVGIYTHVAAPLLAAAAFYLLAIGQLSGPIEGGARSWGARGATLEFLVFAALLIGAVVQGVRAKTDAFPFACYPTFQHHPSREAPDLRIVAI